MKKSELKKLIRESIKELMTEQSQCSNIQAPGSITGQSGWYNTGHPVVQACNGMLPGYFQNCPNCVAANTAAMGSPPSNFQNMIQNGFNNQGCSFLQNWSSNPNHQVGSSFGPNVHSGRLFYPGENPMHQANKLKKWIFVQNLHGNNC
tara:strand:- start:1280 stop:1723 length:444 start_codon:yes stop_codon:yes gene_type:complete